MHWVLLVVPQALAAACSGGGGASSGWPYAVQVAEVATPRSASASASGALRVDAVVADATGISVPSLAFLGDGTPVVGYWTTADWTVRPLVGDLRVATVRAGTVESGTLLGSVPMSWSGLGVGPGDGLAFLDLIFGASSTGSDGSWGYYAGTTDGTALQGTFTGSYPDGFIRAFGHPVASPAGDLLVPMAARTDLGITRLALWRPGSTWVQVDLVFNETDPDHRRLQWGDGCVPSLAYDGDGQPVVGYETNAVHLLDPGVATDTHEFRVARKQGGLWSSELVFSVPEVELSARDRGPYVAVDATGTVHLAVFTQGVPYYAFKRPADASWTFQPVPLDIVAESSDFAFALDHGVPSILFNSQGSGAALARLETGGWVTEALDPSGFVIDGALGVDPGGALWAVYDTESPNGYYLNLARRTRQPSFASYFDIGGKHAFVASRNVTGRTVAEIESLLDKAQAEGTRLVRFHVTHLGGLGITATGGVVESWAASWDTVFQYARARGIQILPVFGVWADWNDGSNGESWHAWDQNPLRGLASSPLELYTSGSAVQNAWLGWMGQLVTRWQRYDNVIGWEIFSELDGVTRGTLDEGAFQRRAIAFVEAAAPVIRAADPLHRPVTASTGSWKRWFPAFYASKAIDLAQIHLYSPGGDLDADVLGAVRTMLDEGLGKPVLLGESGLDWAAPDGSTATTALEGPRATRHAVWAELVSGAMNGRALWWEDGYDILQNPNAGGPAFVTAYPAVERPALTFLAGRDLAGLHPLQAGIPATLVGGAIGDAQTALAWARSAGCSLTSGWSCSTSLTGLVIRLGVPGTVPSWQATFHDPATGNALGVPVTLTRTGGTVAVPLPSFSDDVAVRLTALP